MRSQWVLFYYETRERRENKQKNVCTTKFFFVVFFQCSYNKVKSNQCSHYYYYRYLTMTTSIEKRIRTERSLFFKIPALEKWLKSEVFSLLDFNGIALFSHTKQYHLLYLPCNVCTNGSREEIGSNTHCSMFFNSSLSSFYCSKLYYYGFFSIQRRNMYCIFSTLYVSLYSVFPKKTLNLTIKYNNFFMLFLT